ncbi:unnamed protein product [Mucor circinelloides]
MKGAIQSADHRELADDHIEPSENVNDDHHDFAFDSDNIGGAYDLSNTGSPLSPINEEAIMEYAAFSMPASITTKSRKDYRNTMSVDVKNWFSKSFELNGHPNPCLVFPSTSILGTYACNCADATDFTVYCYMLHSQILR